MQMVNAPLDRRSKTGFALCETGLKPVLVETGLTALPEFTELTKTGLARFSPVLGQMWRN